VGALSAQYDVHCRDPQWPVSVESGRSTSKTFYAETFAITIRAISGLSRQTPSLQMTKSAGSKTWPLMKSNTERSIFGRSGSIKSKMNFDDPSRPSCMMPIVGS
jgi:hypothetical protein